MSPEMREKLGLMLLISAHSLEETDPRGVPPVLNHDQGQLPDAYHWRVYDYHELYAVDPATLHQWMVASKPFRVKYPEFFPNVQRLLENALDSSAEIG